MKRLMKRLMSAICALALLLCAAGMAESTFDDANVAEATIADPAAAETFFSDDDAAGRELSTFFGGDIAQAAQEIGGLEAAEGEEFQDNYIGAGIALHGNGGRLTFIDLLPEDEGDTLCGIGNGMSRADAMLLMNGCPLLWDYPEELAWIVRADEENQLNSETLVLFFNEDGVVSGAWYRTSEA